MPDMTEDFSIAPFRSEHRAAVRKICCETAFLEKDRKLFLQDDGALADFLTCYYTDYEPESCFVAEAGGKVIGYVIGAKNVIRMGQLSRTRIVPKLIGRYLVKGAFLKAPHALFLAQVWRSWLRGEFRAPDFSKEYPATLHINLERDWRSRHLGNNLIHRYLDYLRQNNVSGVHCGTMSEGARKFFQKMGFEVLYESKRSYLKYRLGRIVPYFILGRKVEAGAGIPLNGAL